MASGINKGFQTSYLQPGGGQGISPTLNSGINRVAATPAAQARIDSPLGIDLDEIRIAAGLKPQGRMGTPTLTSLVSSARTTNAGVPTPPIVNDLSSLAQNIINRQQKTSRQLQANRLESKTDLEAFGGFGGDVTGLEPFGGSGQFIEGPTPESMEDYDDDLGFATQNALNNLEEDLASKAGGEPAKDDPLEPFGGAGRAINDDLDGGSDEAFDPYREEIEKAMRDVESLKGGDPDAKNTEDYMKEFAEATGVNIDGKADKSQALMAFGLALMQNKAGKGFDVSKALSALGEAGTAAAPAFQKAKETARANRIAAGKYGLQERKAAAATQAATLAAAQQRLQDLNVKQLDYVGKRVLAQDKHSLEIERDRMKAITDLRVAGIEAGKDAYAFSGEKAYEPLVSMKNIKVHIANRKSDAQEVFTKPLSDVSLLAKGYSDSLDGIASIDKMSGLISEASKLSAGGITGQKLYEFFDNKLSALGLDMGTNYQTGEKLGPLTEADAIKKRVIAQYKRFLTQETGNGISEGDVNRLADSLGNIDFFTNPEQALKQLSETRTIFESANKALENQLVRFEDRSMYLNENLYDKVQAEINSTALSSIGVGKGSLKTSQTKDGITVIKLS
tara:strand:- start:1780 stop:3639 length:1860 start_codon:yes stop_codon:yes gene_type:complete